jgi:hypothetical protein
VEATAIQSFAHLHVFVLFTPSAPKVSFASFVTLDMPSGHARQFLDGLDERELLSLMLSLLRDKCGKLPGAQQDVLQLLLAAVQYRVKSLQNTSTLLVEAPNRAMLPLRRFSLGRFFEVIQQSHQIDVNFKMEIKRLATSARTAVHSTNSRSAQAGRRMDAEWHDSATCN